MAGLAFSTDGTVEGGAMLGRGLRALGRGVAAFGRGMLDHALPPRCADCGIVVDEPGSFCLACWDRLEFLGDGGCGRCGQPLVGGAAGETCRDCVDDSGPIDRRRAVLAYGPAARRIAIQLKYGRKIALADMIARYMAPLAGSLPDDALLVPVPLHRLRLWGRGFNQSVLIARALSRRSGRFEVAAAALRRTRRTPPLKGMDPAARRDAVRGAFSPGGPLRLDGRTVVLIDDVETSGATAHACAQVLKAMGAGRVELLCWARVARPRSAA